LAAISNSKIAYSTTYSYSAIQLLLSIPSSFPLSLKRGRGGEEIASKLCTSAAIIGRYERNERTPSVDIAKKIAEALDVSLDYLVGDTSVLVQDKKMIYRLEVLQKVNPDDKDRILYMLDLMLKDAQGKSLTDKLAS
jgi:transcriptional regulator with XRE-family HTH domain